VARIKGGFKAKQRHKKILKQARGYVGAASRQYRVAKQSVMRAMANAFVGRKQIKRDYRAIWIMRINSAVREHGVSYSKFINALKKLNIKLNRKMLADIACKDSQGFEKLVKQVIN